MKPPDPLLIAQEIMDAQDAARQIEPLTNRWTDFDERQAYEVAGRIHDCRLEAGARPVGRKIGFTNPRLWPLYGVHQPIWGYVYDRTVVYLNGGVGRCSLGGFVEPKIEPEVVVHFHSSPPENSDPGALLECIDWIAVGFEIVQSHFAGWSFRAPDTIADSALHGRLFIGPPRRLEQLGAGLESDLERFVLTLSCDGRVCEQGRGSNVMGGPLRALNHLIDALAGSPGRALGAGEVVTTGTLTAAFPVRIGQRWRADLEGVALPGISLEVEA